MPLITFTSDFGNSDHYVGVVKANILKEHPDQQIIDISHQIAPFDIAHLAYVVDSAFRAFPEGTIHFIGQDEEQGYLAAWIEGHYFVAPNNGVLSLITEKRPELMVSISPEDNPMREAAKAAAKLAQSAKFESLGLPLANFKEFAKRRARATKKEISGQVIRVDHFGNLVTNIDKTDFDILSRDRKYMLHFSRETLNKVNQKMNEVDPGDAYAKFDDRGRLVIGIYQGNGAQLLGLSFDSPITLTFEE
jgi:S-adenosylmethionine hydrolase